MKIKKTYKTLYLDKFFPTGQKIFTSNVVKMICEIDNSNDFSFDLEFLIVALSSFFVTKIEFSNKRFSSFDLINSKMAVVLDFLKWGEK